MIKSFLNYPLPSNPLFVIRSSKLLHRINVILEVQGTGIVVAYGTDLNEMKVFCDMNMIDYVVE